MPTHISLPLLPILFLFVPLQHSSPPPSCLLPHGQAYDGDCWLPFFTPNNKCVLRKQELLDYCVDLLHSRYADFTF